MVRCEKCGMKIDRDRDWQRIVGYSRDRPGGGQNHVALREPLGIWMCNACMTLERSGIHHGQQGLAV